MKVTQQAHADEQSQDVKSLKTMQGEASRGYQTDRSYTELKEMFYTREAYTSQLNLIETLISNPSKKHIYVVVFYVHIGVN